MFEGKMMELYQLVSNRTDDMQRITDLVTELSRYQLNDDDPLKKLLDTAKEYVESN